MNFHSFIDDCLKETDFSADNSYIKQLFMQHLRECINIKDNKVQITDGIMQAIINIVVGVRSYYEYQREIQNNLVMQAQEQQILLKKLGESLGIKYDAENKQNTVWQIITLFNQQQNQINQLKQECKTQLFYKNQIQSYKKQIQSLETINEKQNEMIVTFTKENNILRKEAQSILNDAFKMRTENNGFQALADIQQQNGVRNTNKPKQSAKAKAKKRSQSAIQPEEHVKVDAQNKFDADQDIEIHSSNEDNKQPEEGDITLVPKKPKKSPVRATKPVQPHSISPQPQQTNTITLTHDNKNDSQHNNQQEQIILNQPLKILQKEDYGKEAQDTNKLVDQEKDEQSKSHDESINNDSQYINDNSYRYSVSEEE